MNYTNEQWDEIKKSYEEGKITIGVNLPEARELIMNSSTKYSIFALVVLFLFPLIVCISSITLYGLWGILFIIGFIIAYISVCGMASYSFSQTISFLFRFWNLYYNFVIDNLYNFCLSIHILINKFYKYLLFLCKYWQFNYKRLCIP